MKMNLFKLLLSLALIIGLKISSPAQSIDKTNSAGLNFTAGWFKTNTISSNDTIVFDLSQAVCSGPYFYVPVSVTSDDIIYSVDFATRYDNSKVSYDSIITYKGYLTAAANFTSLDSTLRFTSYSFVQEIEHNTSLAAVRFNFLSGPITESDFNAVAAYLNGDVCSYKFINAVPPYSNITASGPTVFSLGDSVLLTANSNSLCSYLWSTGQTTQTISVYYSGTYTVTATNNGGCDAVAVTNVLVITPLPNSIN